ncbi:MAG TPA: DUF2339 domain-containing protein, partial [Thermoanaerobaculia bacterium]|nr:DUF2339 domain-containing protein [Thermoanaerobaculia bacterium]
FSTLFAAHTLWHLLGAVPTFLLLVLVTAVAVALSIHHDSLFIALLGLIGGFATPALLASGENRPFGLFGYLLLLNAGLAWVAAKRSWPVLAVFSLVFTTLYQWGWVIKFLDASRLPIAMGIFLVFPLLAFLSPALVRIGGRGEGDAGGSRALTRTAAASAVLALAFAFYTAAVSPLGARFALLFGFLFLLRVGMAVIAAVRGPRDLHLFGAGASLLVFAVWLSLSYPKGEAWPGILGFVALFTLCDLAFPWLAGRLGRPLGEEGEMAALAGPLLLFVFPVLFYLEPAAASPGLPFAVLFALLAAAALFALLNEQGRLHYVAAFFAVTAEAVWSSRSLDSAHLLAGIAIYAVFGLFYLGVPLLAHRLGRQLSPEGSGAFLLLLSLGLLFFLAAGPLAQAALWGMALLLVILNAGLFLEAGMLHRPFLSLLGTVLSWILIGVWWVTVPLAASLVPALFLVSGFAVLGLAGNLFIKRQGGEAAGAGGQDGGQYLALVAHAFLFVVAAQPRLSIPPWPFLGAVFVLDLALGVAALWLRRAALWIAALAASDLILCVWVRTAQVDPWSSVALGSAVLLAVLAFLWMAFARRLSAAAGELADGMAQGAAVALVLGALVGIAASTVSGPPALLATVIVETAFLAALLSLARPDRPEGASWPSLAPLSVLWTFTAVAAWRIVHGARTPWWHELAYAGALYLVYLAFPLLLGRRVRRDLRPHLAVVLASVSFFLFAQRALVTGGFQGVIGALPVVQAIALAVVLARLVRVEPQLPAAERSPGRLALVAGAVLACVTAAIPLQLDREWITIGWAFQAAALAALYRKIPHRGLLAWTTGLLVAVFLRLTVNPAVLSYHPAGGLPIWNWYLYTYLVPALAFGLSGWLLASSDDGVTERLPRLSSLAYGGAVVLLFLLVNIEIADFFSVGQSLTFSFLSGRASLPEDLSYTLGWALFAIALFLAGIVLANRPARVAAILLLLVAVLKGFLHDMASLGGLYRIGSFAGLAICLALVAILIQKYVLSKQEAEG